MKDLDSLIDAIIMDRVLKSPQIIKAFEEVDRKNFVPEIFQESAYVDAPLSIGENQTRITSYNVCYTKLLRSI